MNILMNPKPDLTKLPFVQVTNGKVDLWCVTESGSWGEDNATGRMYAKCLISHMKRTDTPILLSHISRAMVEKSVYGGIEVGFNTHIATALLHQG